MKKSYAFLSLFFIFLSSCSINSSNSIYVSSNTDTTTSSFTSSTNISTSSSLTSSLNTSSSTSSSSPSSSSFISSSSDLKEDPYINVDEKDFYKNYKKASSYMDAYYRSKHFLMSGDIEVPNQKPTISKYQPQTNSLLDKNISSLYTYDKNGEPISYKIIDANGNIVNEIYKSGAYISLEEVASYVFAFNDIPANYTSKKSGKPSSSPWKEYLRLNHSYFSGDVEKYPFEPVLPNISGVNNGNYKYYELDIGTLGTTSDPSYPAKIYNNGKKITRGAARIVYSNSYIDTSSPITDFSSKHLFYTYNHYNDFQEYLNYENGWGKMFGNITGGG